jgi:hypothetical protein
MFTVCKYSPAKEAFMPRTRKRQNVPAPLHRRLNAYTLAASAAGVSLLALAQPSAAEIVYTPANATIGRQGSYNLDLNQDGIADFVIGELASTRRFSSVQRLLVGPLLHNSVECIDTLCGSGGTAAAALTRGAEIGQKPRPHGWLPGPALVAFEIRNNGSVGYSTGYTSWHNVRDRYLGLRFHINGEVHFGWARLSVQFQRESAQGPTWLAHLTGYAYETIPNKSIEAGQIGSDDATAQPNSTRPDRATPGSFAPEPSTRSAQFASLGALALGSDGLALWRREESTGEDQPRQN